MRTMIYVMNNGFIELKVKDGMLYYKFHYANFDACGVPVFYGGEWEEPTPIQNGEKMLGEVDESDVWELVEYVLFPALGMHGESWCEVF